LYATLTGLGAFAGGGSVTGTIVFRGVVVGRVCCFCHGVCIL
jgi:hypothetical protein